MIHGVKVVPLRQIVDERGKIMHMLKATDEHFLGFGEIYFSTAWPGTVKAWHIHRSMTVNNAVISGRAKLVMCDLREDSPIMANAATEPHDPDEMERLDPFTDRIPYDWAIRHG